MSIKCQYCQKEYPSSTETGNRFQMDSALCNDCRNVEEINQRDNQIEQLERMLLSAKQQFSDILHSPFCACPLDQRDELYQRFCRNILRAGCKQ